MSDYFDIELKVRVPRLRSASKYAIPKGKSKYPRRQPHKYHHSFHIGKKQFSIGSDEENVEDCHEAWSDTDILFEDINNWCFAWSDFDHWDYHDRYSTKSKTIEVKDEPIENFKVPNADVVIPHVDPIADLVEWGIVKRQVPALYDGNDFVRIPDAVELATGGGRISQTYRIQLGNLIKERLRPIRSTIERVGVTIDEFVNGKKESKIIKVIKYYPHELVDMAEIARKFIIANSIEVVY